MGQATKPTAPIWNILHRKQQCSYIMSSMNLRFGNKTWLIIDCLRKLGVHVAMYVVITYKLKNEDSPITVFNQSAKINARQFFVIYGISPCLGLTFMIMEKTTAVSFKVSGYNVRLQWEEGICHPSLGN